jgi:polar amino acid transport system substrate-binding protein
MVSVVFYHRKDMAFSWEKFEDIRGLRVGVMQGYSAADILERLNQEGMGLSLDYATTEESNFRKLLLGRIDLFPAADGVAEWILFTRFTPEERRLITSNPKPLHPDVRARTQYLIYPKNSARSEQLDAAFDRGMKKLRESGRYDAIMRTITGGPAALDEGGNEKGKQ